MSNSESALAKKDGCPVLAVLDYQRLRTHSQHFLCGARQVGFVRDHFHFGIVDQQHVHQSQHVCQLLRRSVDPEIHGVAPGQAHSIHFLADRDLQRGMDIRQKQELGVGVLFGNFWLELLEHVEVGEIRLGFVQIVRIAAAPAESLARRALNPAGIDATLLQHVFMFRREVVANHCYDAHGGKVAGRQREMRGCAAQNVLYAP